MIFNLSRTSHISIKLFAIWILTYSVCASAVEFDLKNIKSPEHQQALQTELNRILTLLPAKMLNKLPKLIHVVEGDLNPKLTDTQMTAPECKIALNDSDETAKINKRTYGDYKWLTNTIQIDYRLVSELATPTTLSRQINCYHKNMHDQAVATLIHELAHAYDIINPLNRRISQDPEFLRLADFKKGWTGTLLKNIKPLSSPDVYEITNPKEFFAVQLEYWLMDPTYSCARKTMADYLSERLQHSPFLEGCLIDKFNTAMVFSGSYSMPKKIDPKRVYRIDYLEAAPGSDMMSGWGHAMYRLVICSDGDPQKSEITSSMAEKSSTGNFSIPETSATQFGPDCLKDEASSIVVSYRANLTDTVLSKFKGLFGGYSSKLFLMNFPDILNEYNLNELRDVVSYPLKLSEDEKNNFVRRVIEESWNYSGDYKFITNNCAVESEDLIKTALPDQNLKRSSITPNGLLQDLIKAGLINAPKGDQDHVGVDLRTIAIIDRKDFFEKDSADPQPLRYSTTTDRLSAAILFLKKQDLNIFKPTKLLSNKEITYEINHGSPAKRFQAFSSMFNFDVLRYRGDNPSEKDVRSILWYAQLISIMNNFESQTLRTLSSDLQRKIGALLEDPDNKDLKKEYSDLQNLILQNQVKAVSTFFYGIPQDSSVVENQKAFEMNKEVLNAYMNYGNKIKLRFQNKYKTELEAIDDLSMLYINTYQKLYDWARPVVIRAANAFAYKAVQDLTLSDPEFATSLTNSLDAVKKFRKILGEDLIPVTLVSDYVIQQDAMIATGQTQATPNFMCTGQ